MSITAARQAPSIQTDDDGTASYLAAFGPLHPQLDEVVALAALHLADDLARHGFTLTVDTDLVRFTETVRSTGKFVPTLFDRELKSRAVIQESSGRDDAFGLILTDAAGEVIGTNACRLLGLGKRTLADHLSTLAIFYDNPIAQMPSGEYLELREPARSVATAITGQCAWAGCFWVARDLRQPATNLSYILPTAARMLAANWWGPLSVISNVKPRMGRDRSVSNLGMPDVHAGVTWVRPQFPAEDGDMFLMVTSPDTAEERARAYMDGGQTFTVASKADQAPAVTIA
jgi:hypothetical protein